MKDLALAQTPSPNFDERPAGQDVDILLMHYTGMKSGPEALERMRDPAAKVSAHYMVEEDGRVFQLVDEAKRAWHAGVSSWAGESNINARSIGIEIVNPGHEFGYRPFPIKQMAAVADLSLGILSRHPIPPERVLGHSDVAPQRKQDPGELFDWKGLAEQGVGRFILEVDSGISASVDNILTFQEKFRRFGYGVEITGKIDDPTRAVIEAFQSHFRPALVSGVMDSETLELLDAYLKSQ